MTSDSLGLPDNFNLCRSSLLPDPEMLHPLPDAVNPDARGDLNICFSKRLSLKKNNNSVEDHLVPPRSACSSMPVVNLYASLAVAIPAAA